MIQDGLGGGVVGWGLLTIGDMVFSRAVTGVLYLIITIVALTIGLRLPWLTWYYRLKIWLVRRRPIDPAEIRRGDRQVAQSAESLGEDVVPPQQVIIKPKNLAQGPVQATQLPLKVMKQAEPPPPKVKRERVLPELDLLEVHTSDSIVQEEIEHKKGVIENTLRQFGLEAKVVRVSQGPAVTQYGVEPGYIDRPGPEGEVRKQKVRVAQIQLAAKRSSAGVVRAIAAHRSAGARPIVCGY